MNKRKPELEWHILEDQREWPNVLSLPPLAAQMPPSRLPYRLYATAASLALLLLLGGLWLWRQAEAGVADVESELQNTTEAELWMAANQDTASHNAANQAVAVTADLAFDPLRPDWHPHFSRDAALLAMLQRRASSSQWAVEMQVLELDNEWAKVQLTTSGIEGIDGDLPTYRQTRFYRQSVDGWLRTAPSAEHWGALQSLDSTYFSFDFRAQDAEAVTAAAPKLDALYSTLRRNFGLALNTENAKVLVEISPLRPPGAALLHDREQDDYRVPSPALYLAPVTVTDSELLVQSLALLLTADVVDEATAHYRTQWVRSQMLGALRLWALWETELPLSQWGQTIVQRQLTTAPTAGDYEALCAMHSVWLSTPALLSISLTCDEQELPALSLAALEALSVAQLEQLSAEIFLQESAPMRTAYQMSHPASAVMLATLVEYVIDKYGHSKLPALLAALGKHREWSRLTPDVFGVTSAEFAAGWYEYLATHYQLEKQ